MNGPSKGGILVCEECGERVVLDAPLSVWSSGTVTISCQCGERLALAGGLDHRGSGEPCHEGFVAYLAATPLSEEHQRRSGSTQAVGLGRRAVTAEGVIVIIAVGACLVSFIACAVAYYLASPV